MYLAFAKFQPGAISSGTSCTYCAPGTGAWKTANASPFKWPGFDFKSICPGRGGLMGQNSAGYPAFGSVITASVTHKEVRARQLPPF